MTAAVREAAGSLRERLRWGTFPAVPVPLGAGGRLDEAAQERYAEYMRERPVSGVAVWAHTGRGLHVDERVREAVLVSWRKAFAGRICIAAAGIPRGAGGGGVDAAIDAARRMAERAAELGADAVLVHPPAVFRAHSDRTALVERYHEEIARAALPLVAFYLYEDAGGIAYTRGELEAILGLDAVAALKVATLDSACTYQDIVHLVRKAAPRAVILSGEDRFLGYSLLAGAEGALVGLGAAAPGVVVRLVEAVRARRWKEAVELLLAADRFARLAFAQPVEAYIERMLLCLAGAGVVPEGSARDPWGPGVEASERAELLEAFGAYAELERTGGGAP